MLYEVESKDVDTFQKIAVKAGIQLKEAILSNIIIVGEVVILAPHSIQDYYDEFNFKKFKVWQTVQDRPHFYTILNTKRKRTDLADKHRVGYTSTAVFGHTVMKIIVVEVAGTKLRDIDSNLYHSTFMDFLLGHTEVVKTVYETIRYY